MSWSATLAADPIASRYAQALFEASKAEGRLDATQEQLARLGLLIRGEPDLRELLRNPGVAPEAKVGVLDRSLGGSWSALVRAFIRMTVSAGRAEHLPEIVDAFHAMVDVEEGRLRVVVRSAHPLPEAVLTRLRAHLEHRERKHIILETELAPELLGGLQIRLDHRVIDASVQGQLRTLRQQLAHVRVN